eukprot:TRINITY_DN120_c0_g2_i1.p1 TRINITY_DN120_c0_g2~~TRINITY_DN120_c0_g2_i1.p1  ORF type:complete len:508 (-),score=86.68 TRINITY_DN120_c0_g2_i1:1145-2668(-)
MDLHDQHIFLRVCDQICECASDLTRQIGEIKEPNPLDHLRIFIELDDYISAGMAGSVWTCCLEDLQLVAKVVRLQKEFNNEVANWASANDKRIEHVPKVTILAIGRLLHENEPADVLIMPQLEGTLGAYVIRLSPEQTRDFCLRGCRNILLVVEDARARLTANNDLHGGNLLLDGDNVLVTDGSKATRFDYPEEADAAARTDLRLGFISVLAAKLGPEKKDGIDVTADRASYILQLLRMKDPGDREKLMNVWGFSDAEADFFLWFASGDDGRSVEETRAKLIPLLQGRGIPREYTRPDASIRQEDFWSKIERSVLQAIRNERPAIRFLKDRTIQFSSPESINVSDRENEAPDASEKAKRKAHPAKPLADRNNQNMEDNDMDQENSRFEQHGQAAKRPFIQQDQKQLQVLPPQPPPVAAAAVDVPLFCGDPTPRLFLSPLSPLPLQPRAMPLRIMCPPRNRSRSGRWINKEICPYRGQMVAFRLTPTRGEPLRTNPATLLVRKSFART